MPGKGHSRGGSLPGRLKGHWGKHLGPAQWTRQKWRGEIRQVMGVLRPFWEDPAFIVIEVESHRKVRGVTWSDGYFNRTLLSFGRGLGWRSGRHLTSIFNSPKRGWQVEERSAPFSRAHEAEPGSLESGSSAWTMNNFPRLAVER